MPRQRYSRRLQFSCEINAPREAVWNFYDDIKTLPAITPPSTRVRILSAPQRLGKDARILLLLTLAPLPIPILWETILTEWEPPRRFVDVQGKFGPFRRWRHEHGFESLDDGARTRLWDTVIYELPFGLLGVLFADGLVERRLHALFEYRHRKTLEWFAASE